MSFLMGLARAYMSMRECLVPDKTREVQEEIIADLHNCLEQLTDRCLDMESRIVLATDRMLVHAKAAKATAGGDSATLSISERLREKNKAKQYLQEKKRIQAEYDKTQKNIHLIQQQIDSIVSSQLNMVVVDAMKQFNHNAAKLSLPSRTIEIEHLEEQLADRTREVAGLQEAMHSISTACTNIAAASTTCTSTSEFDEALNNNDGDDELWRELDLYLSPNKSAEAVNATRVSLSHDTTLTRPNNPNNPTNESLISTLPLVLPDIPSNTNNNANNNSHSQVFPAMQQLTMQEEAISNTV